MSGGRENASELETQKIQVFTACGQLVAKATEEIRLFRKREKVRRRPSSEL